MFYRDDSYAVINEWRLENLGELQTPQAGFTVSQLYLSYKTQERFLIP